MKHLQELGAGASADPLLVHKKWNYLFLFSLSLMPLLIPAGFLLLLCLERAVVPVFLPVPSLSCPGQSLCSSSSSLVQNSLCLSLLQFLPPCSSQHPTHEEIQPPRAFRNPHKHRISAHPSPLRPGFYSIFFSSSEAGLYVHIFDLRGIIAATRVNNAAVNYKSEYLEMKPALSHSLLPNGNACDL